MNKNKSYGIGLVFKSNELDKLLFESELDQDVVKELLDKFIMMTYQKIDTEPEPTGIKHLFDD